MRTSLALCLLLFVACQKSEPAAPKTAEPAAPAAATVAAETAASPAPADTAEPLIQALYAEHQPQKDKGLDLTNEAQLSRFFTPEMTALFMRDAACAEKGGGICNLDFDPIYAAQDFEDKPLDLAVKELAPGRLEVTFTNLGRRSQIFDVTKTKDGWRIADITYPEVGSLKALLSAPTE